MITRKHRHVTLFFAAFTLTLAVATLAVTAASDVPAPPFIPWQALSSPPGAPLSALTASPAFSTDHVLLAPALLPACTAATTPTTVGMPSVPGRQGRLRPQKRSCRPRRFRVITPCLCWPAPTAAPIGLFCARPMTALPGRPYGKAALPHDLALSPAHLTDHTVFLVGSAQGGSQVRRSTNGGQAWQVVGNPTDLEAYRIVLSPNYSVDHTGFVAGYGRIRPSTNGGTTWQALNAPGPNYDLAISPGFAVDHTLWATYRENEGSGAPARGRYHPLDRRRHHLDRQRRRSARLLPDLLP